MRLVASSCNRRQYWMISGFSFSSQKGRCFGGIVDLQVEQQNPWQSGHSWSCSGQGRSSFDGRGLFFVFSLFSSSRSLSRSLSRLLSSPSRYLPSSSQYQPSPGTRLLETRLSFLLGPADLVSMALYWLAWPVLRLKPTVAVFLGWEAREAREARKGFKSSLTSQTGSGGAIMTLRLWLSGLACTFFSQPPWSTVSRAALCVFWNLWISLRARRVFLGLRSTTFSMSSRQLSSGRMSRPTRLEFRSSLSLAGAGLSLEKLAICTFEPVLGCRACSPFYWAGEEAKGEKGAEMSLRSTSGCGTSSERMERTAMSDSSVESSIWMTCMSPTFWRLLARVFGTSLRGLTCMFMCSRSRSMWMACWHSSQSFVLLISGFEIIDNKINKLPCNLPCPSLTLATQIRHIPEETFSYWRQPWITGYNLS